LVSKSDRPREGVRYPATSEIPFLFLLANKLVLICLLVTSYVKALQSDSSFPFSFLIPTTGLTKNEGLIDSEPGEEK
jgi:hypothetical protein